MPEIDHDWDKIQKCRPKYDFFDKIVMGIVLITLGFCSAALLLAVINNPRFCM